MKHFFQVFSKIFYGSGLLSVAFLAIIFVQWIWVIRGWLGLKAQSLIPLVGGVIGCLAIYTSHVTEARHLWWIPFILDPGSALMLLNGIYHSMGRKSGE